MKRYKGTFDIFSGIEHRMRKEEMEEQFNKEAKQGWRFAADAARMTDEIAGSEDRKHTSGEEGCGAVDSNLGGVIGKEEGAVTWIPGNEGIIVRGGMRVFAVYFWHSEGWTQRDDSTCRSKGPNREFIERTYDCVIASHSLQGKIKNMGVVEDFESRPHKLVSFLVE